jgi:hypothetical protein
VSRDQLAASAAAATCARLLDCVWVSWDRDPPFGLADASALVSEATLHGNEIARQCAGGRDDGDLGYRAAVEQILKIELCGGLSDFAIWVTGKLLPDEIGPVQHLIELVDAKDLKAANHGEELGTVGRARKKALWWDRKPFALVAADQADKALAGRQPPDADRAINDSTRLPSGENATEVTWLECPAKVRISGRPSASGEGQSLLRRRKRP